MLTSCLSALAACSLLLSGPVPPIAVIRRFGPSRCVLVRERKPVVLREPGFRFNQRRGPAGLQRCHCGIVREEPLLERLLCAGRTTTANADQAER